MSQTTDFVWKMGNLQIPFHTYWEGSLRVDDLKITYHPDHRNFVERTFYNQKESVMEVPEELDEFRTHVLSKKIEENTKSANPKVIFNGPNYGMTTSPTPLKDDSDLDYELRLDIAPTVFLDHVAFGQNMNLPYFDGGTQTLEQKYVKDPLEFYKFLPHTLGVNVSIKSSDGYLVLMNRSSKIQHYPDSKGVGAAGFGDRRKDCLNEIPHPHLTALRELNEEAGINAKKDNLILKHIGKTHDDKHCEISYIADVDAKADEILYARKSSKYEGKHFKVTFGLGEDTLRHLRNHKEWGPRPILC
jgi:hypothetical protein